MNGGPSQLDTFDLKPGQPTGSSIQEIDAAVKGIRFSEHLPALAKRTGQLAILRTMTHREADHARGTYLMQSGHAHDRQIQYPLLGSLLGKELGDPKSLLPRCVRIMPPTPLRLEPDRTNIGTSVPLVRKGTMPVAEPLQ